MLVKNEKFVYCKYDNATYNTIKYVYKERKEERKKVGWYSLNTTSPIVQINSRILHWSHICIEGCLVGRQMNPVPLKV